MAARLLAGLAGCLLLTALVTAQDGVKGAPPSSKEQPSPRNEPAAPPKGATSNQPNQPEAADVLLLNIDRDGVIQPAGRDQPLKNPTEVKVYLAQQYASKQELARRQGDPKGKVKTAVVIRAHKDTPWPAVLNVTQACQDSEFRKWYVQSAAGNQPAPVVQKAVDPAPVAPVDIGPVAKLAPEPKADPRAEKILATLMADFDRMDRNKDGQVGREEAARWFGFEKTWADFQPGEDAANAGEGKKDPEKLEQAVEPKPVLGAQLGRNRRGDFKFIRSLDEDDDDRVTRKEFEKYARDIALKQAQDYDRWLQLYNHQQQQLQAMWRNLEAQQSRPAPR